jgi:hypothetical protein
MTRVNAFSDEIAWVEIDVGDDGPRSPDLARGTLQTGDGTSVRRITHLGRKKFFETKAQIKTRETNPYRRRRFSWTSSI